MLSVCEDRAVLAIVGLSRPPGTPFLSAASPPPRSSQLYNAMVGPRETGAILGPVRRALSCGLGPRNPDACQPTGDPAAQHRYHSTRPRCPLARGRLLSVPPSARSFERPSVHKKYATRTEVRHKTRHKTRHKIWFTNRHTKNVTAIRHFWGNFV